jgi:AcrR family transcriptional regulator
LKDKKEQIIRAAAKRFARHGAGKTTLDEIARDVRIGKATIYHYFKSKEELYYDSIYWEASGYIDDIKAIFNNEDIPIGGRLLEYLTYKESAYEKYKLLYDLMLLLMKDDSFEREKEILKIFLKDEIEIVGLILSSIYSGRIESMDLILPNFIVLNSWGLMFGTKLNELADNPTTGMKDLLFKSLENLLS